MFARVVRLVTDRPLATIGVVCALALGGLVLALQLRASDSSDSLVGGSSETERATDRFHEQFGDEAVRVLVSCDLERTLLVKENIGRLIGLETCLSGRPPAGAEVAFKRLPAACRELQGMKAVRSV